MGGRNDQVTAGRRQQNRREHRSSGWLLRHGGLLATLLLLLTLPGCSGCRQDTAETPEETEKRLAEERAKKDKLKPKPDFETKGLLAWPCDRLGNSLKPGHWTDMVLADAKMNNFDFLGDWELVATDRQGNEDVPAPLLATPYTLATSRQVALPKGQAKTLESRLFVPPLHRQMGASYQLRGNRLFEMPQPLALMPSYQYHIVVLSRWPQRYTYLSSLDAVRPREDLMTVERHDAHYRITLSPPGQRPPLPSHAMLWTSIAYLVWDDAAPTLLDADQQRALLDWLHWGGQLIVSGPDTLDELRGSFLGPYLPATAAGARQLNAADLAEMSDHWSVASDGPLKPVRPWAGVQLKKDPRAEFLPGTGELLVERAVGRGRIVVSAFRLSGAELLAWRGWDGLVNACLLRRPPRRMDDQLIPAPTAWADAAAHPHPRDAQLNSRLRFFSRDTGARFDQYATDQCVLPDRNFEATPGPGAAAWNDFNPVAKAARQSLQQAAGIKVLNRMFVVWIVAGYVLVLVPLNWGVFRLLGRVEWAWAAAPLIAIVCTVVVIHMAQLDIGFVRAQNEIAVVELHNDYPRAHVTRYMALYSSLSTGYGFHFDDSGSTLLPFPTSDAPGEFRMLVGESYGKMTCRHGDDANIGGFSVGSNSIGFVHGEQWIDLSRPLSITMQADDRFQVANATQFKLRDAGVLEKTASGSLRTAWLGTLEAGASAAGQFAAADGRQPALGRTERPPPPRHGAKQRGAASRRDPPGGLAGRRVAGPGSRADCLAVAARGPGDRAFGQRRGRPAGPGRGESRDISP